MDRKAKRTYIGYTTDPERRLRQHNGELKGGAKYTARMMKGQARLVCTVGPFPEKRDAMSFEWHWKHDRPRRYGPKGRQHMLLQQLQKHHQPLTVKWLIQPLIPFPKIKNVSHVQELQEDPVESKSQ